MDTYVEFYFDGAGNEHAETMLHITFGPQRLVPIVYNGTRRFVYKCSKSSLVESENGHSFEDNCARWHIPITVLGMDESGEVKLIRRWEFEPVIPEANPTEEWGSHEKSA